MSDTQHDAKFELPRNIERYLATLSKLYAKEDKKQLQEIIVNSKIRIHEEWTYDNGNGGTFGHALYLVVPEAIFLNVVKLKEKIESQIKNGINSIHNVHGEYIANVFLEVEIAENQDWRKESGLLLTGTRPVLPEAVSRIWGDEGYRVFLSHKSEVKKETAALKNGLNLFGVSAFVAHEDIQPTKEWQDEIESALFSMDAFVALMTENFNDSPWTDQEVGVAFGRGIPIISVKLGKDPYGFIGKFQALSCSWDTAAKEIVKIMVSHDNMLNAYINAVHNCLNYDDGVALSEILPSINKLSSQQVNDLVSAFNGNAQVRDCYGFNGKKPRYYGDGLVPQLKRLTSRNYRLSHSGGIEIET